MKRKIITLFSMIAMVIAFTIPISAATQTDTTYEKEFYPDGSYAIITTTIETSSIIPLASEKTKSASRTYTYYAANSSKEWDFTLTGTFTYNGTTAKATKADTSYNLHVSGWKCIYKHGSVSGAVATGQGTFQYKSDITKNVSLSLKCSPTGVISSL